MTPRGIPTAGEPKRNPAGDAGFVVGRLALFVLLLFILLLSCSEDELPVLPELSGPRGAIQGRLRIAGLGARMRLSLERQGTGTRMLVDAESDSAGAFTVFLPAGDYALRVLSIDGSLRYSYWYSRKGPVREIRERDEIRVPSDSAAVPIDLDFGAIDLRLEVPPGLDPARIGLALRRRSPPEDLGGVDPRAMEIIDRRISVRVAPLPAGTYSIVCRHWDAGIDLWLPGTLRPEGADSIVVTTDTVVAYDRALSMRIGRFRGTVMGAWQRLDLHSPYVRAFDSDSMLIGGIGASSSGEFLLTTVGADHARFLVAFGEFGRWVGGVSFSEATIFPVHEGAETVLPPIEDGGLLLRFIGAGREERREMRYRVLDLSGHIVAGGTSRTSGDDLPIAGLAPGEYRLYLEPETFGTQSWTRQWFDRTPTADQATSIPVPEGGRVVPLTVILESGGSIRGRVTHQPFWTGVAFALVPADRDTCGYSGSVRGLADGGYEIRGIPAGAYKLALGPRRFDADPCGSPLPGDWIWYGQTASWDSATVVSVQNGETTGEIDVELPESVPRSTRSAPPAAAVSRTRAEPADRPRPAS